MKCYSINILKSLWVIIMVRIQSLVKTCWIKFWHIMWKILKIDIWYDRMNKSPSIRNHFGLFLVCFYNFFKKYFQKIFSCQNEAKTRNLFYKNQNNFFQNWNMFSRLFWRESSDDLRHSVLSPKRFGQLEMKLEQKARPPPRDLGE